MLKTHWTTYSLVTGTLLAIELTTKGLAAPPPLCKDLPPNTAGDVNLQQYIDLGAGGCRIDDKIFANFQYENTFGATPPQLDIGLSPMNIIVNTLEGLKNPGLKFTAPWSATVVPGANPDDPMPQQELLRDTLTYTVRVLPGGHLIKDNSLQIQGAAARMALGFTGSVSVTEEKSPVCRAEWLRVEDPNVVGGVNCIRPDGSSIAESISTVTLNTFATPTNLEDRDSANLHPVDRLDVRTAIRVQGPAGFNMLRENFSEGKKKNDKPTPKDVAPDNAPKGKGESPALFDATTKELSFSDSIFTESSLFDGTIFSSDTILGATISIPTMTLTDEDGNGTFYFTNLDLDNRFLISEGADVFMTAELSALKYLVDTNSFFWVLDDIKLSGVDLSSPFFDPALPDLGSDFIMALEDILNPLSSGFSNMVLPYVILQPDVDVFSASSGFTEDTSFEYESTTCACMPKPVPEPSSSLSFLALGTIGAGSTLLRNKKQQKSAEKQKDCNLD